MVGLMVLCAWRICVELVCGFLTQAAGTSKDCQTALDRWVWCIGVSIDWALWEGHTGRRTDTHGHYQRWKLGMPQIDAAAEHAVLLQLQSRWGMRSYMHMR
jgi:hypothetical protein